MKKKQLLKLTRSISDETLRRQVEQNGRTAKDYHLYGMSSLSGNYLICYRNQAGTEFVIMDDDDANNFAVAQYLLRQGVSVFPPGGIAPEPGADGNREE